MAEPVMWKGAQVPWAARWTGEVQRVAAQVGRHQVTGQVRVFYEDGIEDRDSHDILWIREGTTRAGEPEFGHLSAFRQRACMRHRKCQVCGNKITSKVIRWLLHPKQVVHNDPRLKGSGYTVTSSPPTCDECIEKSIRLCPTMAETHVIAKVLEYEIFGVSGIVVGYDPDTHQPRQVNAALVAYDWDYTFDKTAVVAKQQVVRWTKFVMED